MKKLLAILLLACATTVAQAQWSKDVRGTHLLPNSGPVDFNRQAVTGITSLSATGTLQCGVLMVGGTSYGGTILPSLFISPIFSGTGTGSLDLSGATITLAASHTTNSGTQTLANKTLAAPVFSGTGTGIIQGPDIVLGSGTASPPAVNTIRVSGTNLIIWSGSNWITR